MRLNIPTNSDGRRWLVLAVTVAAQFMVVLDVAVVNVALPSISQDLHFSQESLQWVITAYSIMFGGALLLGGRLADLLGRRRLFMAGVALFTFSSLLSGLAWSEGSLIVARALQGLGGALLAPAALSIVVTAFSEGRDRNIALAVWGAASGSGGAVGVLLGGVLTSYLSWSWIFFVNLPVGVAVLAVSPWLLSESRARAFAPALRCRRRDLDHGRPDGARLRDHAGRASTAGATASTVGLLAAATALIAAFLGIEARSPAPLLPLRIFRLRTLSAANATMLIIGAAAFGAVPPDDAVPPGGAALLGDRDRRRLHRDHPHDRRRLERRPGADHPAGRTTGADRRPAAHRGRRGALRPDARRRGLLLGRLPGLLVSGIGLAFSFVPVMIAGLTGVQPADAGVASGLINTSRQIGGSVGLAAVTTIAATATGNYAQSHAVPAVSGPALTHGFEVAFYALIGLALAGAAVAAVFVESKPKRPMRTSDRVEAAREAELAALQRRGRRRLARLFVAWAVQVDRRRTS